MMPMVPLIFQMLFWCMMGLVMAHPVDAQSHLCDAAAAIAAQDSGVPLAILRSVTRVETGRGLQGGIEPWPWTLNRGGDGTWHDNADTALAAAQGAIAAGHRNLDLGCFQINHHWHGDAFSGLADMLDPVANARYAAHFLRDLHNEFGDWEAAVGAFHSRNPTRANRYLARYRDVFAALGDTGDSPVSSRAARTGPGPPMPLSMQARQPLPMLGRAQIMPAARPISATPARALWETP